MILGLVRVLSLVLLWQEKVLIRFSLQTLNLCRGTKKMYLKLGLFKCASEVAEKDALCYVNLIEVDDCYNMLNSSTFLSEIRAQKGHEQAVSLRASSISVLQRLNSHL